MKKKIWRNTHTWRTSTANGQAHLSGWTGLWNQMENAAATSLCNRTGVHFGGALQNAHTHNDPPLASAMGLRNGRGISLQSTKPTTIIILAERSNLTFNRSGAAASSLCLSHFFGGGRLSCDFEEENEIFLNIQLFQNDQVQNSCQNISWNR